MKRFIILLLCSILMLAGCTGKNESTPTIPQMAPESIPETIPETVPEVMETVQTEPDVTELLCVSVPAESEHFVLDNGTELFTYTAQHMQLILPDETIADRVILHFLNRVDAARLDAEKVLAAAQNDYDSAEAWYPYFYQTLYSPTRIDHSVLSLFGTQNSYSGATHGSLSCVSANYDLSTGDILTLGSIMHMDATKEDFITLILDKLQDSAEEKQLFEGYEDGVRSRLGGDENLYEDFYFTTTGISFFFAPYEIAPYSAGIITVEIPYGELLGLIYDGYFPAERDKVEGKMQTGTFMETDVEQFNNMAEINLVSGEEIMVAYAQGDVEDVRINIAGDGMNMPAYTVFAALEMSDKNAAVISLDKETMERVSITYLSNGELQTIPLSE